MCFIVQRANVTNCERRDVQTTDLSQAGRPADRPRLSSPGGFANLPKCNWAHTSSAQATRYITRLWQHVALLTATSSEARQFSITALLYVCGPSRDIFRCVMTGKKTKHLLSASNLCAAVPISTSFGKQEKIAICASLFLGVVGFFFSARATSGSSVVWKTATYPGRGPSVFISKKQQPGFVQKNLRGCGADCKRRHSKK